MSILLAGAALCGHSVFAAPDEAFAAQLNRLPKIRIILSVPGAGVGHESTAATVYTRLRQLGYEGEIEIAYPGEYISTRETIAMLIPPFNSAGPLTQEFPELKLSFRPISEAKKLPVLLGIVGATDQVHIPLQSVGVGMLITLQPAQWTEPTSFHKVEFRTPGRRGSDLLFYMRELQPLGYVFELPRPTDVLSFLRANMDHDRRLAPKRTGLEAILKHARELMPVYGHSIRERWQLIQLHEGLRAAQRSNPSAFKGGVVMPVFNEFYDHDLEPLTAEYRAHGLNFAKITDPDLEARIRDMKNGDSLAVLTGRVSKPVFEFIYGSATVVPLVEGKNSANLMQLTGKPYLPSKKEEPFLFKDAIEALQGPRREAYDYIAEPAFEAVRDAQEPVGAIAHFILEARNPEHATARLFRQFAVKPGDLTQDKLYLGIKKAQDKLGQMICDGFLNGN